MPPDSTSVDQSTRDLALTCEALGTAILAERVELYEEMHRPFRCTVDFLALDTLDVAAAAGQFASVAILLYGTDLQNAGDGEIRYVHGVIADIEQTGGFTDIPRYRVHIRPQFWTLALEKDCRIFQEISVPDIAAAVLDEKGIAFENRLQGTYPARAYCTQYRETTLDFLSRLLEEEGIYYFFTHGDQASTLVLCDDKASHEPLPDPFAILPFKHEWDFAIETFRVRQHLASTAAGVSAYDLTKGLPEGNLSARKDAGVAQEIDPLALVEHEGRWAQPALDPGEDVQTQLDRLAQTRAEEAQARILEAMGQTTSARGLVPGFTFALTHHPLDTWNREYLITRSELVCKTEAFRSLLGEAVDPMAFHADFAAAPFEPDGGPWQFRPPRVTPRPVIPGPQTALVVGPDGEEIWTDELGRVKVRFHWDARPASGQGSAAAGSESCWVRVAQARSGLSFGAWILPRVGDEVVVAFLDGDPDRPLVVGSVDNGKNKVPYALPDNKTRSTFKTQSSPQGADDTFNELRFEDKKGEEEIYLQAQKDMNVLVKNDRTTTVQNDEVFTVENDRTGTVQNNETLTVEADRTRTVQGNETVTVEGDDARTVSGKRDVTVTKDVTETFDANHTESCGDTLTLEASTQIVLKVSGSKVTITASEIKLETGGTTVTLGAAEAKIESVNVTAEGSASALVKGAMADLKADGIATVKGSMNMIG